MFPSLVVVFGSSVAGVGLAAFGEVVMDGFGVRFWVGFLGYGFVLLLGPSVPGCSVALRMLNGILVVVFVECRHQYQAPL